MSAQLSDLYRECVLPGFLRGKLSADFTEEAGMYDDSLARVARESGSTPHMASAVLFLPVCPGVWTPHIHVQPVRAVVLHILRGRTDALV
jgi:hypothetical protein